MKNAKYLKIVTEPFEHKKIHKKYLQDFSSINTTELFSLLNYNMNYRITKIKERKKLNKGITVLKEI